MALVAPEAQEDLEVQRDLEEMLDTVAPAAVSLHAHPAGMAMALAIAHLLPRLGVATVITLLEDPEQSAGTAICHLPAVCHQ